MRLISNTLLKNSLALEERLNQAEKPIQAGETEHLADALKKEKRRPSLIDIRQRFLNKVIKTDHCWLWSAKKEKAGYGRFAIREREFAAHRVSYQLFVGDIPNGLTIDHQCNNPSCVRPSHLKPMTMRDNLLRGNTFQAENAKKTHCMRGHLFSKENTYISPNGNRSCKKCRKAIKARYKAKIVFDKKKADG